METPRSNAETRERPDAALGYCGLYCGGCGIYQATRDGRELRSERGTLLRCDGCHGDEPIEWANECQFKACCRKQGLRYCLQCEKYPCKAMREFLEDAEFPYHADARDNMLLMEKMGFEQWSILMRNRHTCKSCARSVTWFDDACPHCETPIE